jgi:regulator of protease activity HflC (stomatin/prohibitin superfamily)
MSTLGIVALVAVVIVVLAAGFFVMKPEKR